MILQHPFLKQIYSDLSSLVSYRATAKEHAAAIVFGVLRETENSKCRYDKI